MNALGYFLIALAKIGHLVINLYTFVVAFAVLLSWVTPDPSNPIVRLLHQLTEPIFWQIRKRLPVSFFRTGIDFTPMIVLFFLIVLDTVVVQLLLDFAYTLLTNRAVV